MTTTLKPLHGKLAKNPCYSYITQKANSLDVMALYLQKVVSEVKQSKSVICLK